MRLAGDKPRDDTVRGRVRDPVLRHLAGRLKVVELAGVLEHLWGTSDRILGDQGESILFAKP